MNLTIADIAYIRSIAEADKAGVDDKAWDETVTPDVVIAMCDKIESLEYTLNEVTDMALSTIRGLMKEKR